MTSPPRRGPRSWRAVALTLAAVYAAGRIAVDIALTGTWSPTRESVTEFALVPLAQSVVVWWLLGRKGSAA